MARVKSLDPAASATARRELLADAFHGRLDWSAALLRMRLALGMTQEAFGRLYGLSRRQVMELETGKANPTVDTLSRIATSFGLAVGFVPRKDLWLPDAE